MQEGNYLGGVKDTEYSIRFSADETTSNYYEFPKALQLFSEVSRHA